MAEKITAKEALKKLDAQLECSICFEPFKQPKLLPCFHVFCKSPCLEKLVARDGHSLTCPTCRHIVPLTEKGVAGLQSDFHIDRLFEVREAFNKAEESAETQCGNCEDGKATGYCRECEDFLCDECQVAHKKMRKLIKGHQLLTLDELRAQAVSLVPPKKLVRNCPKHLENALKIYCETCSVLICNDCTIRLHRDHNYDLLADVFPKHKEELVSSLKPLEDKADQVQQALKAFDNRAKAITDQRATLEADIHKEIDHQHRLLDQRRVELVGELDMLTRQKLKSLAAQRDQVEITQVKLTSCLEYTEGGLQTGIESEVLAMKAQVLKRIEQISTEYKPTIMQPEAKADLELVKNGIEQLQQASEEFLEIVETEVVVDVENSHITGDGLKGAIPGEQKTIVFHANTKQNKTHRWKLNLTAKLVHVKSKSKIECEVVKQQDGQHKISYQPVKRGKHELHLTVSGTPARGSPFPVAVTPSPQSRLKLVREVKCVRDPSDVVVNSKDQIIVLEDNGCCISVLTPEGEKIRTFGTKGSGNGQMQEAYGVAVDSDDNIYVVDTNNDRIQKFNSKGEFLAVAGAKERYTQFYCPYGICYNYKDKYLYVADVCNHRIQVLTTDLKFVRSFGTRGSGLGWFNQPRFVAFDNANNLYVADFLNHRVQVLTTKGKFLRAFSQKANGQKLLNAQNIAIDSSNTVYVSESGGVSAFTSEGAYITSFGGQGSDEGKLSIQGLCVDRNDSVIVSAHKKNQLMIF